LEAVKSGEVRVMQRRNLRAAMWSTGRSLHPNTIKPSMGLKVTPEGIKLRVGMVNRHDYSQTDLDEATERVAMAVLHDYFLLSTRHF
jgi:hypothetical protein